MTTRKIEIFTGNSSLCDDTVKLVQELAGNNWDIKVYDIQEEPRRSQYYAVKAIPSIAIDGVLSLVGNPSRTQLKAFGVGHDNKDIGTLMYLGLGI